MPLVPKLAVPLEMGETGLRTVEQDSEEEVAGCVYVIVATPLGQRIDDLDFGIEDPTFEPLPLDDGEMLAQIEAYEPRAQVTTGQEVTDLLDVLTIEVAA